MTRSLSTLDSPCSIPVEDFSVREWLLDDADVARLRLLNFYSRYEDMVIGPSMLDAFERDIETAAEALVVWDAAGTVDDPVGAMKATIEIARDSNSHIILLAD